MKLSNRFNQEELARMWCFEYTCFWCGKSGADCFHHIISPSSMRYKKGKFNSSILNACPIHNFGGCHIGNGKLHSLESEKRLLKKVLSFLKRNDYRLNDKDIEFYKVYKKMYGK